jgi:hypothetical protein
MAVMLLWAGVALGVVNIGLHAWFVWSATGDMHGMAPLVFGAGLFIFMQARLILRLHSGNAAVRGRLVIIILLRFALLTPSLQALYVAMPALALLPVISALLHVVALALVFLSPGSAYFAKPAQVLQ